MEFILKILFIVMFKYGIIVCNNDKKESEAVVWQDTMNLLQLIRKTMS